MYAQSTLLLKKYFRYAKWSRNLAVGTLVAGIGAMALTGMDDLYIFPPLFVIPMIVFTEKQHRVSLSAYQRISDSTEQSAHSNFHVSLIPTYKGFSLMGFFDSSNHSG